MLERELASGLSEDESRNEFEADYARVAAGECMRLSYGGYDRDGTCYDMDQTALREYPYECQNEQQRYEA